MVVLQFFIGFIFLLFASVVSSATNDLESRVSALKSEADAQQLWQSREWLLRLHTQEDSVSGRYRSHVDDPRFFYAEDGASNPRAELLATIDALFSQEEKGDDHAQCRFVARLAWLKKQLAISDSELPAVECKLYNEWRSMVQASRITLIFPTYHLNSPSSMFGHTLLRLDSDVSEDSSKWLSYAVNFGADVRSSDNSISYAFKGLTGGYPGFFIVTPYFKKIQEYNRIERRDIWEYELDFSPEEVDRLITHLWELKEIKFAYYFFDENCSYRLLELLEVARPDLDLTSEFVLTAIPVDTVRAIESANLIKSKYYRPAQVTELQAILKKMSPVEHGLVERFTVDLAMVEDESFLSLDKAHQRNVVDAAYRLLRVRQNKKARDDVTASQSYKLLQLLNSYPVNDSPVATTTPVSPEVGHESRRLSFGLGEREGERYGELGYRMAFHSLEDAENGFLQGAQINMLNMVARYYKKQEQLEIERFDVVDIFSLTPRDSFFDSISWCIYTGLERHYSGLSDTLAAHVTGGAGVSYALTDNSSFYFLGRLRLENNRDISSNLVEPAVGGDAGVLWHFGFMTARLAYVSEHFSHDYYRNQVSYNHNFVLSRNHALMLNVERSQDNYGAYDQFGVNYRVHF